MSRVVEVKRSSDLGAVLDLSLKRRVMRREDVESTFRLRAFDDDDEALALANDSRFGLVGYCWTNSLARAQAFQQRVDAGTLWINTPLARDLRAPFGGFKESGIGRDGPRQAADFFTEEKATITAVGEPPIRKLGAATD